MSQYTLRVLGAFAIATSFLIATPAIAGSKKSRSAKRAYVKPNAAEQLKRADRRQIKRSQKRAMKRRQKRKIYTLPRAQTPKSLERRLLRMGRQARFAPSLDSW